MSYIVITPFFPSSNSFRGSFVYDQVIALKKHTRQEVVVFKPCSMREKLGFYEFDGVKVYSFHTIEMPSLFFNGLTAPINARSFVRRFKQLGLNPAHVEVAHCHTSIFAAYGLALKRLNKNIKVVLQHHNRDPYKIIDGKFSGFFLNLWFRAWFTSRLYSRVDLHLSVSRRVEENLFSFPAPGKNEVYLPYIRRLQSISFMPSVAIKDSYVLYNGVDMYKFHPLSCVRDNTFTLGCIANFIDLKRQIILIKAVEQIVSQQSIPQLKCIFVGSGPTLGECKEYVTSHGLGDYIEFRSEVSHRDLTAFYNTLDLFVLPSIFEGFGCVCVEAYACGCPFIISEHQGAAELIPVDERPLWTFPEDDCHALAGRIVRQYNERYKQTLSTDINIHSLIVSYLQYIQLSH